MLVCSVNLQHCYQSCFKVEIFSEGSITRSLFSRKISSAFKVSQFQCFMKISLKRRCIQKNCSFKENFTPLLPKDRFFSYRLIGRNDSISKGKGLILKRQILSYCFSYYNHQNSFKIKQYSGKLLMHS